LLSQQIERQSSLGEYGVVKGPDIELVSEFLLGLGS
jgi:hypothetical protein